MRRPRTGYDGHLTAAHETPPWERTPPAARLCVRAPQEPGSGFTGQAAPAGGARRLSRPTGRRGYRVRTEALRDELPPVRILNHDLGARLGVKDTLDRDLLSDFP